MTKLRQTVVEKMAGLTGLLGTFLIRHLFNNPHNQSCTNNKNKNTNKNKNC